MRPLVARQADFGAGLLFVLFGLGGLSAFFLYDVGSAAAMGPGYFPAAVGIVLVLLGGALLAGSVRAGGAAVAMPRPAWWELFWISTALLVFAFTVQWLGYLLAALLQLVLARLADRRLRWREVLPFSLAASALSSLAFIKGLGMQVPLLPVFI